MSAVVNQGRSGSASTGQLIIAGVGIAAVSQMTAEVRSHIRCSDVVFYHATSGVMAAYIRALNPNLVDLYRYYGEAKIRRKTYIQMAELLLREVRKGRRVVAVFHGHPGFFVMAARRASAIAREEGYDVRLLPGVSSVDCMLADLSIDPGKFGLQIVKAGSYLRGKTELLTSGHVAFLQVDSVGDSTFSFTGYKHSRLAEFFGKLSDEYGEKQEIVYYVAPIFPGTDPSVTTKRVGQFRQPGNLSGLGAGILYVPPRGDSYNSMLNRQAFESGQVYGEFELTAIEELDSHAIDTSFKSRQTSPAVLKAMEELTDDVSMLALYRKSPEVFLKRHPNLSRSEFEALRTRSDQAIRAMCNK